MDHSEFRKRYDSEQLVYDEWGRFVTTTVVEGIRDRSRDPDLFFRVPPRHRTKTVDSLVEKAYYRGKQYESAYEQITDKVGTRFVVLLLSELEEVKEVVTGCPLWTYSKDRDFEQERRQNPNLFTYQSVHYVVRATKRATGFPEGLACEIQVRTLLQHAFSELTHDTVYKPQVSATPEALRAVAKSMAFIETTDELFQDVSTDLKAATREADDWLSALEGVYAAAVGTAAETFPRANHLLLNELNPAAFGLTIGDVEQFFADYPQLGKFIRSRAGESFLFRQPSILLLYPLVDRARIAVAQRWPFTFQELAPVFSDLGYSLSEEF